ncbi:MAG: PQQ-binding-like beta-propeller repeat protein [Candidatus Sumerlaeia bacterium]
MIMKRYGVQLMTVVILLAMTVTTFGQLDERVMRNMAVEAENLPAELTEENLLWKKEYASKHVYMQPVIVGDNILLGGQANMYTPEDGRKNKSRAVFYCVDRNTGETKWFLQAGMKGPWWTTHGWVAQPWIEGERIYTLTADGVAMCLDMDGLADGNDGIQTEAEWANVDKLTDKDADIIWQYPFRKEHHIDCEDAHSASPLVYGDLLIFGTGHSKGVKPTRAWTKPENFEKWKYQQRPNLLALDKNTGELVAKDELVIDEVYHGQWSSPVLVPNGDKDPVLVWADGNGYLHGLALPPQEKEGDSPHAFKPLWKIDINPKEYRYDESGEPYLFPLHKSTMEEKAHGPYHSIGTPVYVNGKLYVTLGRDHYYAEKGRDEVTRGRMLNKGALLCIDMSNPEKITEDNIIWDNRIRVTQATPSIVDGLLYIADSFGTFHCIDAETGETVWTHDAGSDITCRSPIVADGKAYVSTDKKKLFVLKAGREKEVLFEDEIDSWTATPGIGDGIVVLSSSRSTRAFVNKADSDAQN